MDARIHGCLLAATLATASAGPALAQSRTGHFDDIPRIVCAEGAERYLPGDYYFCAGNKALQDGRADRARAMYEESASWGDKRAMFNLGLLLLRGEDLARDEAQGLAWLALAAERQDDTLHREVLAGAWKAAAPDVRERATTLWNAMKPRYADQVALVRAQQRYQRETRRLRADLEHDPSLRRWIAGLPPGNPAGNLLAALDQAAGETILWPQPAQRGTVTVGTLEAMREEAPEPEP